MDNFPVDHLLSETTALGSIDFQLRDFESTWNHKEPLETSESDLFQEMEQIRADSPTIQDPFMTSSTLEHELDTILAEATIPDPGSSPVAPANQEDLIRENLAGIEVDFPEKSPEPLVEDDAIYYSDSDDEKIKEEIKEEMDIDQQSDESVVYEISINIPAKRTNTKTRRGKKKKKPKANAWSLTKRNEIQKATGASQVRLYEQDPFQNNPELERCRKNALSAKLNRDKKRKEQEAMKLEMERLKLENQRLKRQEEVTKRRARSVEQELSRLREVLRRNNAADLIKMAKSLGNKDTISPIKF